MQKRVPVAPDAAHCSACMLGHVCIPVGMAAAEVEKLDELVKERVRLEKGKTLFSLDRSTRPLRAYFIFSSV